MNTTLESSSRPVIKLGGATVADASAIQDTLSTIDWMEQPTLVVSAPAGITDKLIHCSTLSSTDRISTLQDVRDHFAAMALALLPLEKAMPYLNDLDCCLSKSHRFCGNRIIARGELWNARLITHYINHLGHNAYTLDARLFLTTEKPSDRSKTSINGIINNTLSKLLKPTGIPVVTGFIGRDKQGNDSNLGRDGSDYTAALVAAATDASRVDFITSTRGIRSADPRYLGDDGLRIPIVNYPDARTIAQLGGGVLHARTIGPLEQANIPAQIFQPGQNYYATHIQADTAWPELGLGIFTNQSKTNEHHILIPSADPHTAQHVACLLKTTLQQRTGLPIKYCQAESDIVKITCAKSILKPCLQAVHDELYGSCLHPDSRPTPLPVIHVVLYGPGKVGSAVLKRIRQQQWLARLEYGLDIRLQAVVNSKRAVLLSKHNQGTSISSQSLWKKLTLGTSKKPALTLVIDTTAAHEIADKHVGWLNNGYAVVTANKLSLSTDHDSYKPLLNNKLLAPSATVGAGLPIIKTLQQQLNNGQVPTTFTAVLSGSINFLLEQIQQKPNYTQALQQAQQLGLVEPDPETDLSGLDTARKSIILARTLGDYLSIDDVDLEPLPNGETLEQLAISATQQNKKLAYLVHWRPSQIQIRLEMIHCDSPLSISGVNNAIQIDIQGQDSLIIKGPGAGVDVTADAVYRDTLLIAANALKTQSTKTYKAA